MTLRGLSLRLYAATTGSAISTQNPILVDHLDIRRCVPHVIGSIAGWLLKAPFMTRLRTLHITVPQGSVDKSINDLCIASGASLQELHLHRWRNMTETNEMLPDLSENGNLIRVYIHGGFYDPSTYDLEWSKAILSQLRRVPFQELIIDLDFSSVSRLGTLDWPMIDTQLSRLAESHPGLTINFSTYVPADPEERAQWSKIDIINSVRDGLPKLALGTHVLRQVKITFLWTSKKATFTVTLARPRIWPAWEPSPDLGLLRTFVWYECHLF